MIIFPEIEAVKVKYNHNDDLLTQEQFIRYK